MTPRPFSFSISWWVYKSTDGSERKGNPSLKTWKSEATQGRERGIEGKREELDQECAPLPCAILIASLPHSYTIATSRTTSELFWRPSLSATVFWVMDTYGRSPAGEGRRPDPDTGLEGKPPRRGGLQALLVCPLFPFFPNFFWGWDFRGRI